MERQDAETIIRYSKDKTEPIHIFTCDEAFRDRLIKMGLTPYRFEKLEGKECSWSFKAPRNWSIKIRPKRVMSEKEAQARGKLLQAARASKLQAQNEPEAKLEGQA